MYFEMALALNYNFRNCSKRCVIFNVDSTAHAHAASSSIRHRPTFNSRFELCEKTWMWKSDNFYYIKGQSKDCIARRNSPQWVPIHAKTQLTVQTFSIKVPFNSNEKKQWIYWRKTTQTSISINGKHHVFGKRIQKNF